MFYTGSVAYGSTDTPWTYFDPPDIPNFDKRNYCGVDSIVFAAYIRTDDESYPALAELFNVTDSLVIANTRIVGDSTSYKFTYSNNFWDDLPDKEIAICIRYKSGRYPVQMRIYNQQLLIYRE